MTTADFTFLGAGAYNAPGSTQVNFSFAPLAGDAQTLYPEGADSRQVASPYLYLQQVWVYPAGESSFATSTPRVYNQTQYITTWAFSGQPPAVGIPEKVFDPLQTLYTSGNDHGSSSAPFVSNQYRWLYAAGLAHSVFGATQARLGRRYLGPVGLPGKQTDFGTPFVSDGQRNVTPPGVQGGVFGEPLVRDFATYLFPVSRKSGVRFGDTAVRDPRQTVGIRGEPSLEVGTPFTYLQTQFLHGWVPEPDDAEYGTPEVANLNRQVFPAPFVSHRFPFHTFPVLENTGRAIALHGADQTEWGGTWVSNYYRSVFQQFAQAPEKAVFGTTQVRTRQVINLLGRGMHTLRVSLPVRVWSNLQTIKAESVRPTAGVGTPWASFSRREIRPPTIVRSVLTLPFVALRERMIYADGVLPERVGWHALYRYQARIRAWGHDHYRTATPQVRNVTPEIHVTSADCYLPGHPPRVGLYQRYLRPAGISHGTSGRPTVADRKRRIYPATNVQVRWGIADVQFDPAQMVPPTQFIRPGSVQAGAGVVSNLEWADPGTPWSGQSIPLGYPAVRVNRITVPSLSAGPSFGTALVRGTTIAVSPWSLAVTFGEARLLGGLQVIRSPVGIAPPGVPAPVVAGPQHIRLGQKRSGDVYIPWDFHTYGDEDLKWYEWAPQTVGAVFGPRNSVQLHRRTVRPHGSAALAFGTAACSLRPQHIRPDGMKMYRRGLPEVFGSGDRNIYPGLFDSLEMGNVFCHARDFGPKWIYPTGHHPHGGAHPPQISTQHEVQLFHRKIFPGSWLSLEFPNQYVGRHHWLYPNGTDMAHWGDSWTSHGVRTLEELDITDDRPHWYGGRVFHEPRGYFINGTDLSRFGTPLTGFSP